MACLVVGLTGTFGSGKSTVGKLFKRFGARRVIDADRIAHEALRPGHPIERKVRTVFGVHGHLNRKALARVIFSSSSLIPRHSAGWAGPHVEQPPAAP